jgi:hypothetical protein
MVKRNLRIVFGWFINCTKLRIITICNHAKKGSLVWTPLNFINSIALMFSNVNNGEWNSNICYVTH